MTDVKRINYRGGTVRFDIPKAWVEEYEPAGGGTFFDDRPDSGTLRLNVLSFSSDGKEPEAEMIAGLVARSGYSPFKDGLALKCYTKSEDEAGERLLIHYWEIAVPVAPCTINVVIFSYTILQSQEGDTAIQSELTLLDSSIRKAVFARNDPQHVDKRSRTRDPRQV